MGVKKEKRSRHAMNISKIAVLLLTCLAPLAAQSYDQQLSRSRSSLAAKQYRDAQTAAEQAIQLDPNRWEGYVLAANAYSFQRLFDDAIGMLQMALAHAPEDKKSLIREALADARKQTTGPPAAPPPVPNPAPSSPNPMITEIVLWKSIEANPSESDLNTYLRTYPNGAYAPLARSRLNDMVAERERKEQQRIQISKAVSQFVNYIPPAKLTLKAGGSADSILRIEIREGFGIQSNTPSEPNLISLRLNWSQGAVSGTVSYPRPEQHKYGFSQNSFSVYTHSFDLTTHFTAAAGTMPGPAKVTGTLRYQACNDTVCLPPKQLYVELNAEIVP
jgi:hypothetical protein